MKKHNNFSHFIITRFNLRNFSHSIDDTEEWINWTRERIILFKKYCLPSFLNQTNKDFTWLIYFDSKTPDEFQYFFDELNTVNFITIHFVDNYDEFLKKYLVDMRTINSNKKWIISTRCDNDDCLEKSAVDTIQKSFTPKNNFLISLASGYVLETQNYTLSHYYYPKTPFVSIIESNSDNLKGVFYKKHTKWDNLELELVKELLYKNNNVRFVFQKPLWMQIVHGSNVSNNHRRGVPVIKPMMLNNFGLNIKSNKQSIFNILNYREYYYWKRYFKSFLIKIFKRI